MSRSFALVKVGFAIGVVLAAVASGGCVGSKKARLPYTDSLTPRGFDTREPIVAPEKVKRLRLRVYADQDYRAQTIRWRQKLDLQIDRVNEVSVPLLGVEFEVVSANDWHRGSPPEDLEAILEELVALDAAVDVDWVVGLVTSLPAVTSSIHHLGVAVPGTRHFVMRGMNDEAEKRALDGALSGLGEKERDGVYLRRKAHKEVVVFLHEWAHTLGVDHVNDPRDVMFSSYDPEQATFSEATVRAIDAALTAERSTEGEVLRPRLSGADLDMYNAAVAAANAGRWEEAWREASPLVKTYLSDRALQALGCTLAQHVADPEAHRACERDAELAPDDAEPLITLAHARHEANDLAGAREAALAARARLEKAPDRPEARESWARLATVHAALDGVTHAETAAGRAGDVKHAAEVLAWARKRRRRAGLPREAARFGILPDREHEYLDAHDRAERRIREGDPRAASRWPTGSSSATPMHRDSGCSCARPTGVSVGGRRPSGRAPARSPAMKRRFWLSFSRGSSPRARRLRPRRRDPPADDRARRGAGGRLPHARPRLPAAERSGSTRRTCHPLPPRLFPSAAVAVGAGSLRRQVGEWERAISWPHGGHLLGRAALGQGGGEAGL